MALITEAALTSGSSSNASPSSASITPTANNLVLIAVILYDLDFNNPTINAPTGNSLTYTAVGTALSLTGVAKLQIFRGLGASPTAGAVAFSQSGATTPSWCWSISQYANVNTTGTNGSGAIVQSATGTGAVSNTGLATLAAFGDSANATYGAFGAYAIGATSTAGTGFTEIHDVQQSTSSTLNSEWRNDNDTTVDNTWSALCNWGAYAVEIKNATPTVVTDFLYPKLVSVF